MEGERDKTIGLDDAAFKRVLGVKRETFEKMLAILETAYTELHSRGGKPPKLSVYDKLLISLQYLLNLSRIFSKHTILPPKTLTPGGEHGRRGTF